MASPGSSTTGSGGTGNPAEAASAASAALPTGAASPQSGSEPPPPLAMGLSGPQAAAAATAAATGAGEAAPAGTAAVVMPGATPAAPPQGQLGGPGTIPQLPEIKKQEDTAAAATGAAVATGAAPAKPAAAAAATGTAAAATIKSKNFVFHTFDSLKGAESKNATEKNYAFTEPIVLVSTLHGLDPKQGPGQGPETSKVARAYLSKTATEKMDPFVKDDIIAFNGYAAMNILVNILQNEPIEKDIAGLVTFTQSLTEGGQDIPALQYAFFMFLAQMIFFANIQAGKPILNIREASFAEQYEAVRKECVAGIGKTPPAFFGVTKQAFETGQKSKPDDNPGQELSWWQRASKGAFVCVQGEVTFKDFIEIFSMGPLAMLKCLEKEKEVLASDDVDAKSLISELKKYREADLFAPEKSDVEISSTFSDFKGKKKPDFATAELLIKYLRDELKKVAAAASSEGKMEGIGQADDGSDEDDSDDEDGGEGGDKRLETQKVDKKAKYKPSATPREINTKHERDAMTHGLGLQPPFAKPKASATRASSSSAATGDGGQPAQGPAETAPPGAKRSWGNWMKGRSPSPSATTDAAAPQSKKKWSLFGRKSPTAAPTAAAAAVPAGSGSQTAECEGDFCGIDAGSTTASGVNPHVPAPARTGPAASTAPQLEVAERPIAAPRAASGAAPRSAAAVPRPAAAAASGAAPAASGAAPRPAAAATAASGATEAPCDNDLCDGDGLVGGGKRRRTRKNKIIAGGGGSAPVIAIKL